MQIKLKYGKSDQQALLPRVATQLVPPVVPVTGTSENLIRQALREPLGTASPADIFSPGEQVVIVTSDITRYTGSEIYLPILVELLNAAGIADEDISIVKSFYFLFENGEFFLGVVLFTFTILFPSVKPKLRIRKRNRESKCPGFVPKTPEPFPSF